MVRPGGFPVPSACDFVPAKQKEQREGTVTQRKVVVIGAGAMGGTMAGALARSGAEVSIIDTDPDHVAAIRDKGLTVEGLGPVPQMPVNTEPHGAGWADLAVVMVPAFETSEAAKTAVQVLKPDGAAVSLQNGLGNAEALIEALGEDRVFMGSTRASADRPAPGCPRITRMDPTTVGELDGVPSARVDWLVQAFTAGGMQAKASENMPGVLWSKFITNCCVNGLSAITGLRMGEVSRVPGLAALRWEIVEECLAVAQAKGIDLEYPDPVAAMKPHTWRKFTQPSMLQHIEQRRPIEIEAINGWLLKEAAGLGIDVPINRAITMLARGRATAVARDANPPDYAALAAQAEAEVERGETPWEDVLNDPGH